MYIKEISIPQYLTSTEKSILYRYNIIQSKFSCGSQFIFTELFSVLTKSERKFWRGRRKAPAGSNLPIRCLVLKYTDQLSIARIHQIFFFNFINYILNFYPFQPNQKIDSCEFRKGLTDIN